MVSIFFFLCQSSPPTLAFLFFILFKTSMDISSLQLQTPTLSEVLDYGRIVENYPYAVLKPNTPQDISLLLGSIYSSSRYNNITVAARGAGHSTYGQAQALDGIVIDMTSLRRSIRIGNVEVGADGRNHFFVDVDGGALWVDVFEETLKHSLSPRSWTDYLYLSVGGTLSVGGIGGQAFKYGPQICNVLELDVVTGRGEHVTCSKVENSELFYGVLGGLGQFGIITRARIILEIAPRMVKWVRLFYDDFDKFLRDEELLISVKEVDYVEGFLRVSVDNIERAPTGMMSHLSLNSDRDERRTMTLYSIEMAIYYYEEQGVQQTLEQLLSQLSFMPSKLRTLNIRYFDFLNRVRVEEQKLRSKGLWEVPHPWLNVFLPRSHIKEFKDLLLDTLSATPTDGPILIYPLLRHKWDLKMSTILPTNDMGDDIFYVVSVLRSATPSCNYGISCVRTLLQQNQKIIEIATSKASIQPSDPQDEAVVNVTRSAKEMEGSSYIDEKEGRYIKIIDGGEGMGAKLYMPCYNEEREWRIHFGEEWERFQSLKSKFDPLHVLTPGQRIFKRERKEG